MEYNNEFTDLMRRKLTPKQLKIVEKASDLLGITYEEMVLYLCQNEINHKMEFKKFKKEVKDWLRDN